jgi:hypothetical protein
MGGRGALVFKADNDSTPGISRGNPPLSPLPGAAALDEAIEAHLAAFDAVPPEVAAPPGSWPRWCSGCRFQPCCPCWDMLT